MRATVLYGSVILFCLIITTVNGDKKWKYDDENKKTRNSKNNKATKEIDIDSGEEIKQIDNHFKKSKSKLVKQESDENSSEEEDTRKHTGKREVSSGGDQQGPKRFIGRIEHGKVKVLRRKDDKIKTSDEDHQEKVCQKSRGGKKENCNEYYNNNADNDDENEESSEEHDRSKSKPKQKIKYSIKFQHEKHKKKDINGDISIMRLHKNGRKRHEKYNDADSSEEDEQPLKRFHLIDEDD